MKIVGRKTLSDAEASPLAKRRLALWVIQVAEARWTTEDQIKADHVGVEIIKIPRFVFNLTGQGFGIQVEALIALTQGVVFIDRIVEI